MPSLKLIPDRLRCSPIFVINPDKLFCMNVPGSLSKSLIAVPSNWYRGVEPELSVQIPIASEHSPIITPIVG